jgi:hypothetical protein
MMPRARMSTGMTLMLSHSRDFRRASKEIASLIDPLGLDPRKELVLRHNLIFGYTEVSLPRASSIFICQSTPR